MAIYAGYNQDIEFADDSGWFAARYSHLHQAWLLRMKTDRQVTHSRNDMVNDTFSQNHTLKANIVDAFYDFTVDVENYYTLPAI